METDKTFPWRHMFHYTPPKLGDQNIFSPSKLGLEEASRGRETQMLRNWVGSLAGSRTGSQLIALTLESLASQDGRLRSSGAAFWQRPPLFKMKQTNKTSNQPPPTETTG